MKTSDVAVVILFDDSRMLINLRPQQAYFGGWWEWPGGKRMADETFEAARGANSWKKSALRLAN